MLQAERPYEVKVPHLHPDCFVFMNMEGSEFVSNTYSFHLVMATTDKSIADEDLLRKPIVVTLRRESMPPRFIHGIISKTKLLGKENQEEPIYYWEVTIVPWLWFLNLESDCRHFQNMTAIQIITKVFHDLDYHDFKFFIHGELPVRDFTVQYRETNFNFISRLLEEEGIFYWFDHTQYNHELVLCDYNGGTENCPHHHTFSYSKGTLGGTSGGEIDHLEQDLSVHTGMVTYRDFNYENSHLKLTSGETGHQPDEIYDYPGGFQTLGDGKRYATIRLEEQEARLRTIQAHTLTTLLIPGYRFAVTDHFDEKVNTSYIVLGLSFSCRQNLQDEDGNSGSTASFSFSAIPFDIPYRPCRRHPKPMIHGIQTAIVTGPAGNEIYCDKFGRVKVHFHWDRIGNRDEKSSSWIRVSSAWAGSQWGQISIPRIKQEVVVSFLEGDPDRPLITGRVYNDLNMPPYALPDNQTQSGIKSRSTTGGGSSDFNEFRFEDMKGSEQVYLHAQKDYDEYIEDKHTITVEKGDQIIKVEAGDQITMVQKGNRKISVDVGNNSLKCGAGKISENAAQEIKMECGASSITMTPGSIELKIGGSTITMNPAMITMKSTMIMQN